MGDVRRLISSVAPHRLDGSLPGHNYVLICCPFHGGGQEKTPSCSVSLEKPVFFCHACLESGHLTRLLRTLGMGSNAAKEAVSELGLRSQQDKRNKNVLTPEGRDPFRGTFVLDDDMLDDYRQAPSALLRAGFAMSTLRHFEVGFDDTNVRITFPLRNIYGDLVGVSGRAIIPGVEPRYKIYKREIVDREEFNVPLDYSMDSVKNAILWHGHIARPFLFGIDDEPLFISEGFKACMWVWQAGYKTSVAIIGAHLSDAHAELIATSTKYVCLFLDNNEAGWKGTFFAAERLMQKGVRFVIARYPDDREQPDDLSPTEVQHAVQQAQTFTDWKVEHDGLIAHIAWKRALRRTLRERA